MSYLLPSGDMVEWKNALIPSLVFTTSQYLVTGFVAFFVNSGGLSYAAAEDLKLPMVALFLYLYSLYVFLFRQGMGRSLLNSELAKSTDKVIVAKLTNLGRVAENSIEQCPIFLVAFLAYSILVDAHVGGVLAIVYIVFMWLYMPLFGKIPAVFISTIPRYMIVEYMVGSVFLAALRT